MTRNLGRITILLLGISILLIGNPTYSAKLSRNSVFVSQPILYTLEFNYTKDDNIANIKTEPLVIDDFWIQELNSTSTSRNNSTTKQINYLIFPQKQGLLLVPPTTISFAQQNQLNFRNIWQDLKTAPSHIISTPLPTGIYAIGNFKISIQTDKNQSKASQPVHLEVKISGIGNLDDIKPLPLNLSNQQIYSTKPHITTDYKGDVFTSLYTQKFTILSRESYTIPAFRFSFLSATTNKITKIQTEPLKIDIANEHLSQMVKSNIMYGAIGLIVGALFTLMFLLIKSQRSKLNRPIIHAIKKSKNNKELYHLLLPYASLLSGTDHIINLEQNIYHSKKNKIKKRDIIKDLNKQISD